MRKFANELYLYHQKCVTHVKLHGKEKEYKPEDTYAVFFQEDCQFFDIDFLGYVFNP